MSSISLRCLEFRVTVRQFILLRCLNFCLCLFRMRRARIAPTVDAAFENEIGDDQSVQDEIPPAPRRRGQGRVRAAAAQQPDQVPPEPEILAVDPAAFATGMAGINQGLVALNQAMPLVQ